MLPWSRAHRFRLVFTAVLVVAGLAGIPGGTPLGAQEQPAKAVLLTGPTPVKGIPVYGPNEIPAYRGVYAVEGAQVGAATEARELSILFTRRELLIPQNWSARRCGNWRMFQVPDYETFTLCYQNERGFFLFFFFPEIGEPAYWCDFADPFIERFLFLLNFIQNEADVPFPAILQVGR